jgi:hypothetical protein
LGSTLIFQMCILPSSSGSHCPDDGGNMPLWNVGILSWDYTVLYPRKLSPSYLPPWEPEISHSIAACSVPAKYGIYGSEQKICSYA